MQSRVGTEYLVAQKKKARLVRRRYSYWNRGKGEEGVVRRNVYAVAYKEGVRKRAKRKPVGGCRKQGRAGSGTQPEMPAWRREARERRRLRREGQQRQKTEREEKTRSRTGKTRGKEKGQRRTERDDAGERALHSRSAFERRCGDPWTRARRGPSRGQRRWLSGGFVVVAVARRCGEGDRRSETTQRGVDDGNGETPSAGKWRADDRLGHCRPLLPCVFGLLPFFFFLFFFLLLRRSGWQERPATPGPNGSAGANYRKRRSRWSWLVPSLMRVSFEKGKEGPASDFSVALALAQRDKRRLAGCSGPGAVGKSDRWRRVRESARRRACPLVCFSATPPTPLGGRRHNARRRPNSLVDPGAAQAEDHDAPRTGRPATHTTAPFRTHTTRLALGSQPLWNDGTGASSPRCLSPGHVRRPFASPLKKKKKKKKSASGACDWPACGQTNVFDLALLSFASLVGRQLV